MWRWLSVLVLGISFWFSPLLADDWTASDTDDDGEADPEELFKPFDTGLFFMRRMFEHGDVITHVPYFPTAYNDTRDVRQWKLYISHWEQDPPSFLTLYLYDDSPHNDTRSEADLLITINQYDEVRNLVEASRRVLQGVTVNKGITRVPVNIHNYKGDIVQIKILAVRQKFAIKGLEIVE